MLLEIIFKGLFSILDVGFLPKLFVNSTDVRFSSPEIFDLESAEEILRIFQENEYADLYISTNEFHIGEKIVPNVFVNLTKDNDYFEILIFFDLRDVNKNNEKNGVDELMNWTNSFQKEYNFDCYVCQMDNADEKEYYFNSSGPGPLYNKLSH